MAFPRFSLRDVARAFSSKDFERGRRYFEQGRVRRFDVTEHGDGTLGVRGEVQGSGGRVYVQELDIERIGDELDVFSSCSCPVGFDCKHVVAVCLTVRRYLSGAGGGGDPEAAEARLRRWLGRIDRAGAAPGGESQHLVYVLLARETPAAGLGIELRVVRRRKDGRFGKGRPVRMDRVVDVLERPEFVQPIDEEAVRLLRALCPQVWDLRPELRGGLGFAALDRMLATGRCTFGDAEHPPLAWGEARCLELAWFESDDGRLGLELSAGAGSHVLATDPPVYVDPEAGCVGRLQTRLRPEQVDELLGAPTLLAGDAEALARLLTNEFPDLPLPPPVAAPTAAAEQHPLVPCLTLAGRPGGDADAHELRLGFEYGGHAVPAAPATSQSLVDTPEGPIRLHRDPDGEARALARLTDLGFRRLPGSGPETELRLTSGGDSRVESASRWSALVQDVVPALRDEGWRIREADGYSLRFQPGRWHGRAVPAPGVPNDWFSLRFDLEVDGERWPLLPLLFPLLELGFDRTLPPRVSVPLTSPDGVIRYVDLPTERLTPFLDTLREVFDPETLEARPEELALSRFDAGAVARLEAGGTRVDAPPALAALSRRLAAFDGIRPVAPPEGLRARLRGYQQQGLDWLQFLREYELGGILADDMGLGKTLQALAHLLVEKTAGRLDRPAMIVAPTSLMGNWRREAARFTPALSVLVLHGPDRRIDFPRIPDHDVVLTTYPLLARDRGALEAYDYHLLILDEAQTVKNPRSKAAAAVRALPARHRLCLTGTPLENHLGELWAQFDFLMPGFLGDQEQFRRQWRRPIEEQGDEARRERLARRVAPFMLRRRKADVLDELPPKTEIVRTVALGEKQAGLYESVRLAMDDKVRRAIAAQGLARSHITILDALLKLRQICCDPRLVSLDAAREVKSSAKLELLMQLLPAMLEEGRRVLVFSQFTRMLELIEPELLRRGIGFVKLTGQTRKRDDVIDRFRRGAADVFLISLKAGGVGLNLTEADTVILYDPWWNPAVEAQAADRAHRIGQQRHVFVYQLVTEGTVEEKILALQERKRELAEGVYAEGGSSDGAGFDAAELERLLAPAD